MKHFHNFSILRRAILRRAALLGALLLLCGAMPAAHAQSTVKVHSWGNDGNGQLGDDATIANKSVPVDVLQSGALTGKTVTQVSGGSYHALALDSDGKVYSWGSDNEGELGDGGSNTTQLTPVAVVRSGVLEGRRVTAVSGGDYSSFALSAPPATLFVSDASVTEGNSGTVNASFTVTLSPASTQTVTVNYATANNTASAPGDYTTTSGTLTFNPGDTTKTITVPVVGDTVYESNETFFVNLSGAVNATLNDAQGAGTISNNDSIGAKGGVIAYASQRNGDFEIFVMNADGSNPIQLTDNSSTDYYPVISPDGSKIAFTSDRDGNSGLELYVMNVNGSGQTRLTTSSGGDYAPDWSPDSSRILFVSASGKFAIINANGTGLTTLPIGGNEPAWSPDGTKIVYESSSRLYTANIDGSNVAALPASPGASGSNRETAPDWSPDGARIGFTSNSASVWNIYSAAVGSATRQLMAGTTAYQEGPSYSPDGTRIVYLAERGSASFPFNIEVCTGDVNNGTETRVTNDSFWDYQPSWGPGEIVTLPTLSINDVTLSEGNSGNKSFTFTVTRSGDSTNAISATYNTSNGTATASSDYVAVTNGAVTIAAGATTGTFNISVIGDTTFELDETFNVTLSAPTGGATLSDAVGVGTIQNDDSVGAKGGVIAYQSTVGGNTDVWVMNADGSTKTQLTTNAAYDGVPQLNAAGTRIVFVSNRNGNTDIYAMNRNGTGQTRLTTSTANDNGPTFTPSGRIVWVSDGDIWIMDAGGTNKTRLTTTVVVEASPDVSPDGSKIVFYTEDGNSSEIWVMNSDGTGTIRLTNNGVLDANPDWSPDGQKIVFSRDAQGGNLQETFVMNADGTNQTRVVASTQQDFSPTYSPDGSKIAFSRSFKIWTINADGTGGVQLSSGDDGAPSWAPGEVLLPTLSALDLSIPEGQDDTVRDVAVTVSLSAASNATVSVNYAISNGTALVNQDYLVGSATGTLTFSPGQITRTVSIGVAGDIVDEPDETLFVTLSNPVNATIARAQATVTLLRDEAGPLVVDMTADTIDANDNRTSLREAITYANTHAGADSITFALRQNDPGFNNTASGGEANTWTIQLTGGELPALSDPDTTLDGTSQTIFSAGGNTNNLGPEIVVKGTTSTRNGLSVTGSNCLIKGLVLNGFVSNSPTTGRAIIIGDTSSFGIASGSKVEGCYIGTNATGTARSVAGALYGIHIQSGGGSVTIGGTTAAQRNVISGNGTSGVRIESGMISSFIQGNFIGTNALGNAALLDGSNRTQTDGVTLSPTSSANIGGASAGQGNVISGNSVGINIDSSVFFGSGTFSLSVIGNYIGPDAAGTNAIGNGTGISLVNTNSTSTPPLITVGLAGAGNVISGNGTGILLNVISNLTIQGNKIGTNAAGTGAMGNTSDGIRIMSPGAPLGTAANPNNIGGTSVGAGNVIAFNGGDGVNLQFGNGWTIRGNAIYSNAGLGIDLGFTDGVNANDTDDSDFGANNGQNFPAISTARVSGGVTTINGTLYLRGTASQSVVLDFYSNTAKDPSNYGEGQVYLGSKTLTAGATDGIYPFSFDYNGDLGGQWITATATNQTTATGLTVGDTSEFSLALLSETTTAVRLIEFEAESLSDGVWLGWRTGLETDNLGFRLYRQVKSRGKWQKAVRLTPLLIAGSALQNGRNADPGGGFAYGWSDRQATPSTLARLGRGNVRYWLQDVDTHGKTTNHGPASPTPGTGNLASHKTSPLVTEVNRPAR